MTSPNPLPDNELLNELLYYCPILGTFKWKVNTKGGRWTFRIEDRPVAGSIKSNGYLQIRINGTIYLAHRLAWKIIHGLDPKLELDHIDNDKLNNSISNLQEITHQANCIKRSHDNERCTEPPAKGIP